MPGRKKTNGRLAVLCDGKACALQHIDGLFKTDGILLPSRPATTFQNMDTAEDAVTRTETVARTLRTSLVSDFVKSRCPELATLFTKATYEIVPAKLIGA